MKEPLKLLIGSNVFRKRQLELISKSTGKEPNSIPAYGGILGFLEKILRARWARERTHRQVEAVSKRREEVEAKLPPKSDSSESDF